jgi:phospholipid/cholesterol/gamma-HCH transport system substrate-binding protein
VLVAALLIVFWPSSQKKYIVADFPRTVSLYEGSDVKILGVPVGKVDSVVPEGTKVRVKLSYDSKYKVPANAKAAVISPSVVGDRFVQLTPAYGGGEVMADNTHLGIDRTATPLELDEIFRSLNDLNIALGPDGANKLSKNDQTVRSFNNSLASGADLLAGERQDLAAVLRNLSTAMTQVRSFVQENKSSLTRNISGLNRISKTLVKQRDALDKTLQYAPTALNNLYLAGNVKQGTLDTRDNAGQLFSQLQDDPAATLCTLIGQANPPGGVCSTISGAMKNKAPGRAAALSATPTQPARVVEPIDPTMGGLLEPTR